MTPVLLIAQARTLAEPYLPDSCAIQQLTTVNDGAGGFSETWTTIETVAGLVEWVNDREQVVGGAPRGAVMQKLRLRVTPITQAIQPSQRIVVAARYGKPELFITQPKRLDQSYEVLVSISGVIDVSNPEQ